MKDFLKIIRTLRKSSLEDIAKKIGLPNSDIDKNELAKEIEQRI